MVYTREMQQIQNNFGISETDANIIFDCISSFPKNDIEANEHMIERCFLNNIKTGHYKMLWYLFGYMNATENAFENFYKNLELCQRQN